MTPFPQCFSNGEGPGLVLGGGIRLRPVFGTAPYRPRKNFMASSAENVLGCRMPDPWDASELQGEAWELWPREASPLATTLSIGHRMRLPRPRVSPAFFVPLRIHAGLDQPVEPRSRERPLCLALRLHLRSRGSLGKLGAVGRGTCDLVEHGLAACGVACRRSSRAS